MQTVHVNYPALDPAQFFAATTTRSALQASGIFLAIGLVALVPALAWYGWHQQWYALAVLGGLLLWIVVLLNTVPRKNTARALKHMQPLDLTLLPPGLLTTWQKECYQFHVWALFKPPVVTAAGITLEHAEDGETSWIPRVAFANESHFQEYAAQAVQFQAAAAPTAAAALPRFRETRWQPCYVLECQLSAAEQNTHAARLVLQEQFPHTLPPGTLPPKWKVWLFMLAVVGTMTALLYELPGHAVRPNYTPLTILVLALNIGWLWVMLKIGARLFPRRIIIRNPQPQALVVTLCAEGLRCEQHGIEVETAWPQIDTLIHNGGKLTLWRQGNVLAVIPERVFQSPDAAQGCAEWLTSLIPNHNVPVAAKPLASTPTHVPDRVNPYQAPRH